MKKLSILLTLPLLLVGSLAAIAADAKVPTLSLDAALRERCLSVLRAGLAADEFWPSMHAAEALSLEGRGSEVLKNLETRTETDDQKRCGLAREAVRAGDRSKISVLLSILAKAETNGHTHAAESLFKVAEVGDGKHLRAALAQNDDLKFKLMAAAALIRCGNGSALDVVRAHLKHEDREIKKISAWILGQLGNASDVPPLQAWLKTETDPLARAYIINALACLGDAESRRLLGENLSSTDAAVRTYSADFSGPARAVEFRDKLVALLDDETLDVRVRAAQSLLALASARPRLSLPIPLSKDDISRDVYPASVANPRYSEGSVVALNDGALLYATTEFVGGGADHATARIIGYVSRDGGRSWSERRTLQENVGKQNVMSTTLRRLEPGRQDGPLGMFYVVKNGPDDLKVYLRIRDDKTQSFGEPILVTDAPGYHVMNNDRVTVLSTGRLVCPIAWTADVFKAGGGHFTCHCYLSDDGGKTWRKSAGEVDQPKRGAMEPEVIELADGKLMMIIRTQLGHIATSISSDGGDHWGPPGKLPVKAPESPATIRRVPATGDLLLIWNNNFEPGKGHGGMRTPLSTAVSSDEGKTWHHVRDDLETRADQQFAYTSVTFVADRVLLSYYVAEKGKISSRFRSLPVSWLYAGQ